MRADTSSKSEIARRLAGGWPDQPAVARYRVLRQGLGQGKTALAVGAVIEARTDLHEPLTSGRWALLERLPDEETAP